MDIIAMLKEDHGKVKELFERLESSTTRATRARVDTLMKIERELQVHMAFEEQVFYPAVKAGADKEGVELVNEAYAEHAAAVDLMSKLKAMAPEDEMWKANMMVLKENIEHHVKEEEGELFKQARELVSKEQLTEMGAQYEARKAEARKADAELAEKSRPKNQHIVGLR